MQAHEEDTCPVLTLDYRNLSDLFDPLLAAFGGPMYNERSQTRRAIDGKLSHACQAWRVKYPWPCTPARSRRCVTLLRGAILDSLDAQEGKPYALLNYHLDRLTNDESAHALLSETAPSRLIPDEVKRLTDTLKLDI